MSISDKTAFWISLAGLFGMVAGWAMPHAALDMPIWFWKGVWWISFPTFILSLLILLYSLYKHVIKPKIKGNQHMWPMILMGLGVFLFVMFFGVGAIMFYVQQSKVAIQPTLPPQPTKVDNPFFISYEKVVQAQARLHLLERYQSDFEGLMKQYDNLAQKRFMIYIDQSYKLSGVSMMADRGFSMLVHRIQTMEKECFNDDINLVAIDKKYDVNMPFPEEKQIEDNQLQYRYRKARYEYLSGKEKLDNLKDRFQKEIRGNEGVITEYAKRVIKSPK